MIDWLENFYEDVDQIKRDLDDGCEYAKKVAIGYSLLEKCPRDPGAQGVTHAAYEDWVKNKKVNHDRQD